MPPDHPFIAASAEEAAQAYRAIRDGGCRCVGVDAEFRRWFPRVAVAEAVFNAHRLRDRPATDPGHPMPVEPPLVDTESQQANGEIWSVHTIQARDDLERAMNEALTAPSEANPVAEAMDQGTPVGLAEIAELLGVGHQTARNWHSRGLLPSPRWTVSARPGWSWQRDIVPWARRTNRYRPSALPRSFGAGPGAGQLLGFAPS